MTRSLAPGGGASAKAARGDGLGARADEASETSVGAVRRVEKDGAVVGWQGHTGPGWQGVEGSL